MHIQLETGMWGIKYEMKPSVIFRDYLKGGALKKTPHTVKTHTRGLTWLLTAGLLELQSSDSEPRPSKAETRVEGSEADVLWLCLNDYKDYYRNVSQENILKASMK